MTGCAISRDITKSSRSATEQLLLSQAIESSLRKSTVPISSGTVVTLSSSGLTGDHAFLRDVLTGWLSDRGIQVRKDEKDAAYHVNVIVQSLGSEAGDAFFGMPEVAGGFFPIAFPELAIYKAKRQKGYAKFYVEVYQIPDHQLVASTPPLVGSAYYHRYTVFFFLSFVRTDLVSYP